MRNAANENQLMDTFSLQVKHDLAVKRLVHFYSFGSARAKTLKGKKANEKTTPGDQKLQCRA
jgi:hypothetical protein